MTSGGEQPGTPSTVDPAREFLEFWKSYFEQTAIHSRILLEGMQGDTPLEQVHDQWVKVLSEGFESFMRTPAFLEVLKQSIRRMIDLKLAQDQLAQSVVQQAGLPRAADAAGVLERVQGGEQSIMTRLAQLDARLAAIESKLESNRGPRGPRKGK